MEREIVVRGTGEARALPDQASLTVEVTADRKTQDEAYDARTKLAATVDGVLERHANAIDRATIASLVVRPRTRWHRGEDIRTGWQASRTSFVDIVVLDALGDIMAGLVDAGAAVQGPRWSMAPSNPAYDQARRAAAEDARRGLCDGARTVVGTGGLGGRARAARQLGTTVAHGPDRRLRGGRGRRRRARAGEREPEPGGDDHPGGGRGGVRDPRWRRPVRRRVSGPTP
jgi:hypothetical protein